MYLLRKLKNFYENSKYFYCSPNKADNYKNEFRLLGVKKPMPFKGYAEVDGKMKLVKTGFIGSELAKFERSPAQMLQYIYQKLRSYLDYKIYSLKRNLISCL